MRYEPKYDYRPRPYPQPHCVNRGIENVIVFCDNQAVKTKGETPERVKPTLAVRRAKPFRHNAFRSGAPNNHVEGGNVQRVFRPVRNVR
jgi:hypothetical protein